MAEIEQPDISAAKSQKLSDRELALIYDAHAKRIARKAACGPFTVDGRLVEIAAACFAVANGLRGS